MSRRIEGSVRIAFTVNTDGPVANVRVVSALPDDVCNHAAVEAVEQYRFSPDGRRQDSEGNTKFSLGGRRSQPGPMLRREPSPAAPAPPQAKERTQEVAD